MSGNLSINVNTQDMEEIMSLIQTHMNKKLENGIDVYTSSISSNLNTARRGLAGCGSQIAALSFGGAATAYCANTEKFNTAVWANTGNLNTARFKLGGCGIQNAALSFAGYNGSNVLNTEKFNGSVWANTGNIITARSGLGWCGLQDAALSFGGLTTVSLANTEKFDGSVWSNTGNLNTARYLLAGCGLQSTGLSFGGFNAGMKPNTEKFDGSVWSNTGNLNTARQEHTGCGLQGAGLTFAGSIDVNSTLTNITEKFNGLSWSNTGNIITTRYISASSGTQSAGLLFGGKNTVDLANTEKFDGNNWASADINFGNLISSTVNASVSNMIIPVVIGTSGWVDETSTTGLYRYRITDPAINNNLIFLILDVASQEIANNCGMQDITNSGSGYVDIYSEATPLQSLNGNLLVFMNKEFTDFDSRYTKVQDTLKIKRTELVLVTQTRTLLDTDEGCLLKCLSTDPIVINIPDDNTLNLPLLSEYNIIKYGTGSVSVAVQGSVKLNDAVTPVSISKDKGVITVKKVASNDWIVFGATI